MALSLLAGKKRSASHVSFQNTVVWGAVRTPDCRAASDRGSLFTSRDIVLQSQTLHFRGCSREDGLGPRRGSGPANSGKPCKPHPSTSPAARQALGQRRSLAGQRSVQAEKLPRAPVCDFLGFLPAEKRGAWRGAWGEASGVCRLLQRHRESLTSLRLTLIAPVE